MRPAPDRFAHLSSALNAPQPMPSTRKYLCCLSVAGLLALLGWCALVAAQTDAAGPAAASTYDVSASASESASADHQRLREGMRISDARGRFEVPAEGPTFVDESGRRLPGLENLNLQRIARTLLAAENPDALTWKVSGLVTEYEGRNYILIERAVYTPGRR
jgi:hypothetical protein